jgi:hypothetical protein
MAKKTKLIPLTGAADFKAKADEWAKLDNEITALEAQLGEEQDALLKKYEHIGALKEKRTILEASMEAFAVKNENNERAICYPNKRSGESTLAEWGLALNPPALSTLKGYTWAAVTNLISTDKALRDCIKSKPSLDKETLKARIGDKPERLAQFGLCIEQGTTFTITRKASEFGTV